MKRRNVRYIGVLVIGGMLIVLLTYHLWLTIIAEWLIVEDSIVPVDSIVVSTGSLERIDYAIQLWKQGVAPKIFISASNWIVPGVRKSIGELVKDEMILSGIPQESLFMDYRSQSTYEDAIYSREWALKLGINSIIVIEDPFGMRRLRWTFRKIFAETSIQVYYVAVPPEQSTLRVEQWWTREKELLYVFEEYVKLILYWIKY
jgi:uncharacterized SAM-binding protein YcdF (DUF218 family)